MRLALPFLLALSLAVPAVGQGADSATGSFDAAALAHAMTRADAAQEAMERLRRLCSSRRPADVTLCRDTWTRINAHHAAMRERRRSGASGR